MTASELVIFIIIGINILVFFLQQGNADLLYKLSIIPGRVFVNKEYFRIISSAFGHTGFLHLGINMFVLYSFAPPLIYNLGILKFVVFYLISAIGSSLYILLMRKDDRNYAAIGASGAISGIMYAFAFMFPLNKLQLIFLPIPLEGWIFTGLFTVISLVLTQLPKAQGFVSHEGHLGGGFFGGILALIFFPNLLLVYPWFYPAVSLVPIFAFILIKLIKPDLLYKYLR